MKNERFNGVPIAVTQMVTSMLDEATHQTERFNKKTMIINIRDYCNAALDQYDRQVSKEYFDFKRKVNK